MNHHKVVIPSFQIKVGLMKQFVKSLPRDWNYFKYLVYKFSALSETKLKEGGFVSPDIRRLMAVYHNYDIFSKIRMNWL